MCTCLSLPNMGKRKSGQLDRAGGGRWVVERRATSPGPPSTTGGAPPLMDEVQMRDGIPWLRTALRRQPPRGVAHMRRLTCCSFSMSSSEAERW